MPSAAYAVVMSYENMAAIASEKPHFDKGEFDVWMIEHNGGYFIRDESSQFDCEYIDEEVFSTLYTFASRDEGTLFRQITRV